MYQGICGKLSWCKWRRHDDDVTTTCPWHGDSIATALRRHGDDAATTWRRLGDGIATTWRRHGDHMATTWRRHGDVVRTTTTTVRTTMTAMTRTTATITRQSYIGYGVDIDIHMAMVWWCRSAFVTTKLVFHMFFPRWAPCFLNLGVFRVLAAFNLNCVRSMGLRQQQFFFESPWALMLLKSQLGQI